MQNKWQSVKYQKYSVSMFWKENKNEKDLWKDGKISSRKFVLESELQPILRSIPVFALKDWLQKTAKIFSQDKWPPGRTIRTERRSANYLTMTLVTYTTGIREVPQERCSYSMQEIVVEWYSWQAITDNGLYDRNRGVKIVPHATKTYL